VLLTGVLIFMYVGTEAAIGGWIAAYAQRLGATAQSYWALTPSLFYVGLLTGRAAASVFLRRISETRLIFFSLIGAVSGILVIILGQGLLTISIGAVWQVSDWRQSSPQHSRSSRNAAAQRRRELPECSLCWRALAERSSLGWSAGRRIFTKTCESD
jgi:hypothetical protein